VRSLCFVICVVLNLDVAAMLKLTMKEFFAPELGSSSSFYCQSHEDRLVLVQESRMEKTRLW
jgi:hypothetical protein